MWVINAHCYRTKRFEKLLEKHLSRKFSATTTHVSTSENETFWNCSGNDNWFWKLRVFDTIFEEQWPAMA